MSLEDKGNTGLKESQEANLDDVNDGANLSFEKEPIEDVFVSKSGRREAY